MEYTLDKTFEKIDYQNHPLPAGEYENCLFKNCNFANANLSGINFSACAFIDCNLCLVQLAKTVLRDVRFVGCKLLGIHLEDSNEFGRSLAFEQCQLNNASFYQMKLKKTSFKNTQLREVDFTESDLAEAIFDGCDLAGAIFDYTNLEKADLRTSFNYAIHPEKNRIRKARFAAAGIQGLLEAYDITIE